MLMAVAEDPLRSNNLIAGEVMQIEERGIMSDKTSAKIGVVACALLLLIVVFVAGFSIYKHMKADNIDGFGTLTVDHCEHIGPWDFNYRCYGSWQQGAGLVLQPQAMVDVVGVYKKDDMIPDVYPASSSDAQKISTSGPVSGMMRFVTGSERRSLMGNLPAVIVIVLALDALLLGLLHFKKHGYSRTAHKS